jgi:YVTN family beta-propeller protein
MLTKQAYARPIVRRLLVPGDGGLMIKRLVLGVAGVGLVAATSGAALAAARPPAAAGRGLALAGRATVYVQNAGADTVTPINSATRMAGTPIRVGFPFGLAITPNGRTVYSSGIAGVIPISTATNRAGKAIWIRGGGGQLAMAPNGKTLYVASANTITPVNVATNTAGKRIVVAKQPDGPEALAVTPNSKTVYAVNTVTVVPINAATDKAGRPIHTGATFVGLVFTPNGKRAYVLGGSNVVILINTITNKVEKAITVGPPGADPWAIAITPNGKTVYITNYGTGTVVPINTATNKTGKPIKVGAEPTFIAVAPNGKTIYAVSADAVYPIRIATNKAEKPIRIAKFSPIAIAITPNGMTAWISGDQWIGRRGFGRGFAVPFSTATNIPGHLIKVGNGAANCLIVRPWRSARALGPTSCD